MSDLASTSEKGRPTDEELNVWSQEYLPDEAHFRVPRLIAEVRRLRASPAPAESGEPVAWLRTERQIYEGVPGRTYTTNDPEVADLWRLNDYTESLVPLFAHPPAESAGSPSTSGIGVTIKPLEWSSEAPYGVARVPKIGLMYSTEAVWYEGIFQHVELLGSASGRFPTVAAARAAAQADYEARIRSALAYPPDPSRDTQPALLSTDETQEGGNG